MKQLDPNLQEQIQFNDTWNLQCRSGSFNDLPEEARIQGTMVIEMLLSLNKDCPAILEVGCGTGWLTQKLAQFGDCTGIDLSPIAIEIARKRSFPAHLIAADFLRASLPLNHFDICINIGTVPAFVDQRALFDKMASLMKPGGFLYIITNNRFVFDRRRDIGPPEPGQVRNWVTYRSLRRLLHPHFAVLYQRTILPAGDRGILRIVNSVKLNNILRLFLSDKMLTRLKEYLRCGRFHVVLARKRNICMPIQS